MYSLVSIPSPREDTRDERGDVLAEGRGALLRQGCQAGLPLLRGLVGFLRHSGGNFVSLPGGMCAVKRLLYTSSP